MSLPQPLRVTRDRQWPRWGWAIGALLVLFTPLRALDPGRPANSYSIQGWFIKHGLPSYKIRAVTQTRDGYLWVATAQGIARFDGNRFTVFTGSTNPELQGGGFFAVQEAPDGTLWFGGDHGLYRWREGSFERFTTEHGLANNSVRALALGRDGAIVVCTRSGYSFVRDGRITTPAGPWTQVTGVARSYLERRDGTVLLGTDAGLWERAGEKFTQLSGTAGLKGNTFTSLLETADGTLWIGYSLGVRSVRPDGKHEDFGASEGLVDPRVYSLRFDRDGCLWIGTYGGGLHRMARGRIESANYSEEFGMNAIWEVHEDREGTLWVAAATGLFQLKDNVSRGIGAKDGLAQSSVFSALEASDGTWWIGLWGGGVFRYDQNRATLLPVPASLGLDQVLSFAEVPAGTMWIGTNSGLFRHVGGETINLYDSSRAPAWRKEAAEEPGAILPGIAEPRVNAIAADGGAAIWVATDGGLYHGREGEFRVYGKTDGLPGDVIKSVIRTRNGDVWITAPPHGVARWRGGKWTNYLCGEAIADFFPRAVYEDAIGTIWVTTEGGGLNRFRDERWRTFTVRDGLADDFISGIVEDLAGNFWVSFPRGVMRIPRDEFDKLDSGRRAILRVRVFDQGDGLLAAENNQFGSPSASRSRDGRLLFPTDRGLSVVDPSRVDENLLAPPMHIERMVVNGVPADPSRPLTVPPGNHDLEIAYTAVSLVASQKLRFKIRLAPLDSDWVDAGQRRDVRYARLPPGKYTFQAIAGTSDGLWNESGATTAFIVRPFVYQTSWFIGLTTIGAAGIAFGIFRMRVRMARRRLAGLETLVAERTRQLQLEVAKRNRVAEALMNSETFLHSLVENVPASVFRKDTESRFVFANERCSSRHKRSREDMVGRTDADFYPAELARCFRAQEQQIMSSGNRFEEIQRGTRPDGTPAWFHTIKIAVVDGSGAVIGTQGIIWDVTEREQALEELRAAKEASAREHARFRFIFESLSVGVSFAEVTPDGTRTRVINEAHLRICGLTREQADEPGIFLRISHPEDYAKQVLLAEQLTARKIDGFSLEKRYIRPSDGQEVWAAFRVERRHQPDGSFEDLSTVVDITALKRAEEATARERARFQFIFESLPVGVSWMRQGKLATRIVNPAHVLLSGVPMERSCELALYRQNTHPDDRGAQETFHQRLVRGEIERYSLEKRYVRPDGSVCWVTLNVGSFRDETSGEVQEITSLVDITERKTAELEREKMHRQLLEISRQAGMAEVATGVLHNVGNVLNSVNVASTVLTERVRTSKIENIAKLGDLLRQNEADLANFVTHDPRGRQVPAFLNTLSAHLRKEQSEMLQELESLRKNIDHIKDIVAMQQSYAKVSGVVEELSVTELIEDALRMNRGAFERHGVALERDFQANPVITVEKHKVLQILVNLLRNAKYACDESGRSDKRMTVRVSEDPTRVKITISDNGVGIPPENLTRIFGHGFTTRKEGHGFGLHSGALAAKELGGALTAYSAGPGQGATFVLELPHRIEGKAA